MLFIDLYKFSSGLETPVIPVKDLGRRIVAHHTEIGEITFTPVVLDENTTFGYVVYDYDRSSAYGDEFKILGVRYSDTLNRCHRRFVCCKEIMHAFDSDAEKASSRELFVRLLRELETSPLEPSALLQSENRAEWMALLALCPKPRRDALKAQYDAREITMRQIAELIAIPEWAIHALMSDAYDDSYAKLIGDE